MSPQMQQHYEEKSDGHIPAESELINSFAPNASTEREGRSLRVSPFQVESILGIRNDKPIDYDANMEVNSVDGQEGNVVGSPKSMVRASEPDCKVNAERRTERRPKPSDAQSSPLSEVDSLPVSRRSEDYGGVQVCLCTHKESRVVQYTCHTKV